MTKITAVFTKSSPVLIFQIKKWKQRFNSFSLHIFVFKGAFDFLGLNHYTTNLVREEIRDINWHSYESDQDIDTSEDPCWNT